MAKKRRVAKMASVKTKRTSVKTRRAAKVKVAKTKAVPTQAEQTVEMEAEELQCDCGSGLAKSNCCGSA